MYKRQGDKCIRYGLTAIKNVGKAVIDGIVAERERNGKFKDLEDFITRTSSIGVNKRAIENFIKAGAFDSLGATRKQMMMVYIQIMDGVNPVSYTHLDEVKGIGIGLPGPVLSDGTVLQCVNLGWGKFNVEEKLSSMLHGVTVKAGNDANVAALGEAWKGGGKDYDDVVMITL